MSKTKTETKKSNDFSILNKEEIAAEVVTNIVSLKKADKRAKFYLYWILGLPLASCGRLAGYTKEYSYKLVQKYRNNRAIRTEIEQMTGLMPEKYKTICQLKLAQISVIEDKALGEYDKDPKLAIRSPKLLRDLKVAAGALGDDTAVRPQTININNLQAVSAG